MKRTSIALATAFTLSCTAVSLPEAEEIMEMKLTETNNEVENIFSSNYDRGKEVWLTGLRIQEERLEQERLEAERLAREEAERLEQERLKAIEEENRRNSVSVDLDFVLTKSNLLASELYEVFMFLEKPEMAKLSEIIIETESITGINAMIISGVIANESSWGTSRRAIEDKNFTGYGVYSDDSKGINHGTAYDNIVNTFKDVKKNYLTEGGIYFTGYSTYHINLNYSASEEWRITVNNIAKTIESIYHKFIKNS